MLLLLDRIPLHKTETTGYGWEVWILMAVIPFPIFVCTTHTWHVAGSGCRELSFVSAWKSFWGTRNSGALGANDQSGLGNHFRLGVLYFCLCCLSGCCAKACGDYYVNWHKNADEPYPSSGGANDSLEATRAQCNAHIHLGGAVQTGVVPSIFANERVYS